MNVSYDNPLRFGPWIIYPGPGYTLDSRWEYCHEDYDGPEDDRYGFSGTLESVLEEIQELDQ